MAMKQKPRLSELEYRPCVQSQNVAVDAVRGIIEHFCAGSVENLLVGMVM